MKLSGWLVTLCSLCLVEEAAGKDIYKCKVDGSVRYSEEKCDDQAAPVKLKDIAAPLSTMDARAIEGQDARIRESSLQERIQRRHKTINRLRQKMQDELAALYQSVDSKSKGSRSSVKTSSREAYTGRHSVQENDPVKQAQNIADSIEALGKEGVSSQVTAIVNHYKALIEVEQFQINLLLQELKMNRELNASGK